jgi:hypothetical protein
MEDSSWGAGMHKNINLASYATREILKLEPRPRCTPIDVKLYMLIKGGRGIWNPEKFLIVCLIVWVSMG